VLAAVFVGTIAFGFAAYAVITAIWPTANDGTGGHRRARTGARALWCRSRSTRRRRQLGLRRARRAHPRPDDAQALWRNIVLVPTLYLAVFVWDARLAFEPSITRLIMIGVILIVLMNARPQGLVGSTRVEATG
jgi:hypothetical protein